jgi:hypothetical protein
MISGTETVCRKQISYWTAEAVFQHNETPFIHFGFDVLTELTVKSDLWNVTPCSPVQV